ncbi:MAG: hypothetical protein J7L53_12560 [Deltaproteobacteria bacterium]|nr:hypothetical protein [Deltaproteobacteria bacterium]
MEKRKEESIGHSDEPKVEGPGLWLVKISRFARNDKLLGLLTKLSNVV